MFKVLILQTMHSLSDEDRLSFMRFLGLGLADPVPDANTIWTFRETLSKAGAIEVLFRRFDQALKMSGYLAMGGQIVDATIVAAPKQRNTNEEKQTIKQGRVPDAWQEKPAKLAQKDRDARWTVKYSKASHVRMACRKSILPFPLSDTRSASRKVQIVLASGTGSAIPSPRKRMKDSRSLDQILVNARPIAHRL